jgi:hypothetical protein
MAKSKKRKYRSKFEQTIATQLGNKFKYEEVTFKYVRPQKYTVDFTGVKKSDGTPLHIETKGRFLSSDRTKMLLVMEQNTYNPSHLDIRLVFMKDLPLYKGSKTKYSDWCKKYGFKYAIGSVPKAWLKEVKSAD